jgi:hypothetical protein
MKARKWMSDLNDYLAIGSIDFVNNECGGLPYNIQEGQDWITLPLENLEFAFQKDIDNNDVFAGDILLTDECDWVGYVIYNYSGFVVVDGRGGFSDVDYSKCKVLGNIKQNPELITKYKLVIQQ